MTTIESITVKYIENTVVEIKDVMLNNGVKQTRYWLYYKTFLTGKCGRLDFNLLWHHFKLYLQSRKLDAIKKRRKIMEWIVNACPSKKIKKEDRIEIVTLDRQYRLV